MKFCAAWAVATTSKEYLELYQDIKKKIPDAAISTDIIVGFPGESEEAFEHTLDLVRACRFDNAYTFIYSPRPGTPAAKHRRRNTAFRQKGTAAAPERALAMNLRLKTTRNTSERPSPFWSTARRKRIRTSSPATAVTGYL